MTKDGNDFLAEYVDEVQTYVPTMRDAIKELRVDPHRHPLREELHRLAHIIRGASAMIGIDALSKIAGRMEDTLERTLSMRQILSSETLAAMEAAVARIESYCQNLQQGIVVDEARLIEQTEADFRNFDADMMLSFDSAQESIFDETPATVELSGSGVDDELMSEFRAEAEEHLEALHQSMQVVERQVVDTVEVTGDLREALRKIRRSVHTIKGASGVIGLTDLAAYAHQVEDVLDWQYETAANIERQVVELLSDALDLLATMILEPALFDEQRAQVVLGHLQTYMVDGMSRVPGEKNEETDVAGEAVLDAVESFADIGKPQQDVSRAGSTPDSLFSEEERQILYEGFLEEADEHLQQLYASIQILGSEIDGRIVLDTEQKEEVRKIRRAVHTIKGASAVIGLRDISAYAHGVEDFLDWLYEGPDHLDSGTVEALAAALDHLGLLVESPKFVEADRQADLLRRLLVISQEDKREEPLVEELLDVAVALDAEQPEDDAEQSMADGVARVLPGENNEETDVAGEAVLDAVESFADTGKPQQDVSRAGSTPDSLFSEEERQILYEGFLEEADEHLQQLYASIHILGAEIDGRIVLDTEQKEEVRKIRRAVHTIKGASAVIGLRDISAYAHGVEDFLDWLYEGPGHLDPETVEALTAALDHLGLLVESPKSVEADRQADLLRRLLVISQEDKREEPLVEELLDVTVALDADQPEDGAEQEFDAVTVALDADQPEDGAEQEFDAVTVVLDTAPASLEDDAEQEFDTDEPRHAAAFEASRTIRIHQEQLDVLVNLANELLVGISGFDRNMGLFKQALEEMELTSRRLKDIALELETKFEVKALDQLSRHFAFIDKTVGDIKAGQSFSEFDALELDRYTQLNLIIRSLNESTIDVAAIHANLDGVYSGINGDISRQHRVIRELQNQMMRTRMSPLSTLSSRLSRTMRDVAFRLGKRVRLVMEGERVELDRMVCEKLADPCMHLVRNAIHHGIESGEERQIRNKPALATITLSGRREGNHIVIRFSDDGRGLDFDVIREKARQFGMKETVDRMNNEQLTELIFYPGFSTKTISEISGRGIGMDVVRANIKELQGTVAVETQPGVGTTFVLRVPITVGVIRALQVKVGEVTYGIALNDIKDIHRLEQGAISFEEGTCNIAGETSPWYSLAALLGVAEHEPDEDYSLALNMFAGGRTIALSVPQITGQKEIVMKGLGTHLRSVGGVSGAAVMGDGSIVPVLDIPDLVQAASTAKHGDIFSFALDIPTIFTVMIVDDSISIRRVMSRLVTANGWVPIEAKDGLDAMEKLEKDEVRPDCIVLDIEMPRMNGFEFLAKLPNISRGKDIPVVMLTSRTSSKHQEKAMQLGASAFLNKPCKDEEFVDTVLRLTGRKEALVAESGHGVVL